jgi:hypothetical protein
MRLLLLIVAGREGYRSYLARTCTYERLSIGDRRRSSTRGNKLGFCFLSLSQFSILRWRTGGSSTASAFTGPSASSIPTTVSHVRSWQIEWSIVDAGAYGSPLCVAGPMYQQEFWMFGEHTLADLKDRIRCPVDFNIVGKQQVSSWSNLFVICRSRRSANEFR